MHSIRREASPSQPRTSFHRVLAYLKAQIGEARGGLEGKYRGRGKPLLALVGDVSRRVPKARSRLR